VKLDLDTLPTVPDAPPEAGPDRAMDPPPPDPGPPAKPPPGTKLADVAEGDVTRATESPIAAHSSAAATIHPLLLFNSDRRTVGHRACLAVVTEVDLSDGDAGRGGGATSAPPKVPATDGNDVALDTGRAGGVWWGIVWFVILHEGAPLTQATTPRVPPFI
jgi:hypothetical protein